MNLDNCPPFPTDFSLKCWNISTNPIRIIKSRSGIKPSQFFNSWLKNVNVESTYYWDTEHNPFKKKKSQKKMKHIKSKLKFEQMDIDLFRSKTNFTTESAGWRIKVDGQFISVRGKSIWKSRTQAKSAFTRKYLYAIGDELRARHKNSIPYDVYSKHVLKFLEEHLVANGVLQFVEIP